MAQFLEFLSSTIVINLHYNQHQILCEQLHGLMDGHYWEIQLQGFKNKVAEDFKQCHQTDILVMDFSKAFDKICSLTKLMAIVLPALPILAGQ